MPSPSQLERQHTLLTAAARYDALRRAELTAPPGDRGQPALDGGDALELLALSEVLSRKAGYGRQLTIRTARAAGASWAQIGEALGVSRQSAWEAHSRWIADQADQHAVVDHEGLDAEEVAAARALRGADSDS